MQKIITYVASVLLFTGFLSACKKSIVSPGSHTVEAPAVPPVIETDPAVLTPYTVTISPDIKGYYDALPARYNETTQKYPVIFFFHGGGQYGDGKTNLNLVLNDGIPKLLRDKIFPPSFTVSSGTFSFIVIIPQLVKKVDNFEIDSLINYSKRKYRIDTSRIYLSGFSLGGRQVGDYAAYNPRSIAAITAMAGMPSVGSTLAAKCEAMASAELPIWQFHAKNDSAWKYTESEKFVNTVNSFNPVIPARLTLFEKGIERLNHNCWTEASDSAYKENGKNIYEWMLGYTR
jgi:predicted peptidase